MANTSTNIDISTIMDPPTTTTKSAQPDMGGYDYSNIDPQLLAMSAQPDKGEHSYSNIDPTILANMGEYDPSNVDPEILAMFDQSNKGEEDDSNVDPEILAMLEEANQAFKEGLEEQAACDLEADLDFDDALDREFQLAFAALDEEEPGWDDPVWSDRSGANSRASFRSFDFEHLPGEYRYNDDDDARSEGSNGSLYREKIPPVGMRPILQPKSRVRATPAEKAPAAMMPFTVSNPADVPTISFPSNPYWGGAPIPSSGQQTLTFMGVTTSVPVLSDTANMELVNNTVVNNTVINNPVGVTDTVQECSTEKDRALVGLAMQELNTATHKLIAAGVHSAALETDIRRLEEARKESDLKIADLETRLSEKLDSTGAHMAATKELQICRNALAASQQSCNAMNKENGELKRQVSEIANAANSLDKESNEIRYQVTELANKVSFVNEELDARTRERDFAVQKLGEAQAHIDEAVAANNYHRQQIAIMESNAAAKEAEVNTLMTALTMAETEKQDLARKAQEKEENAAAKEVEVQTLMTALTMAETEKQDLERKAQEKEENVAAREVEVMTLMTALTKAESEKQDLERKAQEKEDKAKGLIIPKEGKAELSKTEQHWKDQYDAEAKHTAVLERNIQAFEQDYYDMQGQYKTANIKVSQLTDTVAEMKAVAQHKEYEISELTHKVTKLSNDLGELESSTKIENANHYAKVEKLKKDIGVAIREKNYIDGLLTEANDECTSLNRANIRHKKKINDLDEALRKEKATTSRLQEQVKNERNSSDDALHVSRIAAVHRAQRTHGFPRPPRDDRHLIPTLDEQLAAWKEDKRDSEKFMEDHRRMLKEKPMTPLRPITKPKDSSTDTVGPSKSHNKASSVSEGSSTAGVGPHGETASNFDDSSVTAVEPSVSSDETDSELEDSSDTENESYASKSKKLSAILTRRPKKDVKYVEQLVYVDKELIIDKIIEHTVHQARSPIWAFLFVYVDLWTIFAHSYPNFAAFIRRLNPVNIIGRPFSAFARSFPKFAGFLGRLNPINIVAYLFSVFAHYFPNFGSVIRRLPINIAGRLFSIFAHYFPNFAAFIRRLHLINTAYWLSSGILSNLSRLIRINTKPSKPATSRLTDIDIESQTKEPTVIDLESQVENLTEPDTHPKVIHRLPPLWPNLLTAILQLLTVYILYQSHLIYGQRSIWLTGNEITRSTVAHFWGREPGFFGIARGPSNWYICKNLCFWLIRGTGYSYALPG
ncbi:hypothetical protein V501_04967 [Pseudogymnoascus sp. VKM F-4519 (FW-2642)]|nr:hypothetical protein V501_04967 [Pseudogymnoascus sp. VKM F-4519 (FW-2642)]